MNWEDEEIDALFNGAKAPEAPAFEESFWKEMEVLLPEQQRRKAVLWWWLAGAAGIALLVTGTWFLLPADQSGNPVAGTTNSKQPVAEETVTKFAPHTDTGPHEISVQLPIEGWPIEGSRSIAETTVIPAETPVSPLNPAETALPEPAMESVALETPAPETNESVTENLPLLPLTANTTGALAPPSGYRLPKAEHYYLQIAGGVGQSAQRDVEGRSDFLHYYSIGGGLVSAVGRMYITFGIQARMDVVQNVLRRETPLAQLTYEERKFAQLYSFEMPLAIGRRFGANTLSLTFTPGFQSGYTGQFTIYDSGSDEVLYRNRTHGRIAQSKTLTMEAGVSYLRKLSPNWYAGCSFNVDCISPFGDGSFSGRNRLLPVNGNVLLRRTF